MVFYIYTYFWVIQCSESCICKIFVNSLKLAHNLTFFTLNWLDWKWHLEQSEALLIFFLFIYWFGWWQWYGYVLLHMYLTNSYLSFLKWVHMPKSTGLLNITNTYYTYFHDGRGTDYCVTIDWYFYGKTFTLKTFS